MLLLTGAKPYRAGKKPNYVSKDKHCTHIGNNVNASYVEQYKVDGEFFQPVPARRDVTFYC